MQCSQDWGGWVGGLGHSQLDDDGAGFDLVHFHEGETFCAREPLLGLVVLEFEEDGCPCGGWRVEGGRAKTRQRILH